MRYHIVPNFSDQAVAMRQAFDAHFATPTTHRPATHQIWNYWYVPQLYTYLRTEPEKVVPRALIDAFVHALRSWAIDHLGFDRVMPPTLSMYVDGCGQGLHNDAGNGRWAYVFSLTRWQERRFVGGETILFHDRNYWDTPIASQPAAGGSFYDLVAPEFNQLLVFDDRLIHGVERIAGSMNPHDSRVVLHGHIREGGIVVSGALAVADVRRVLDANWETLGRQLAWARGGCVGVLSIRLQIAPTGVVEQVWVLTDQISRVRDGLDPAQVRAVVMAFLRELRFPPSEGVSFVLVPVTL